MQRSLHHASDSKSSEVSMEMTNTWLSDKSKDGEMA
jgi:hypothetical protein